MMMDKMDDDDGDTPTLRGETMLRYMNIPPSQHAIDNVMKEMKLAPKRLTHAVYDYMHRRRWITKTTDLSTIYGDRFVHAHLPSLCDLPNYKDDVGPVYLEQLRAQYTSTSLPSPSSSSGVDTVKSSEVATSPTSTTSTLSPSSSTSSSSIATPSSENESEPLSPSSPSSGFTLVASPLTSRRPQCWQRPSWLYYPGLDAITWHQLSESAHAWAKLLIENFAGIRAEFMNLRQKRFESFDEITNSVAAGGKWNTYYLVQQGNWMNQNLDQCPITAKCLRSMPVMAGCPIGFCYFSVLQPGTHITSHHGATNLKLRAQFALQVPCNDVRQLGIRVGNECRAWREGELMLFDDSFEHEVWYWSQQQIRAEQKSSASETDTKSTSDATTTSTPSPSLAAATTASTSGGARIIDPSLERVVLLFDFWNPLLTDVEIRVLNQILPQVIPVPDK